MLPHLIPHPPHLDIPKYIPHYHNNILSRPRLADSDSDSSLFDNISHLLPSTVSPTQSDSPADTVDEDHLPSPHTPPGSSGNYHYVNRGSGSFDSPISPTDMYENNQNTSSYSTSSNTYHSATSTTQNNYTISTTATLRDSDPVGPYLSDSPSPVDVHPTSSFPHPLSAPHSQDHFPPPAPPPYQSEPGDGRFNSSSHAISDRYPRHNPFVDKYPNGNSHTQNNLLDQRRMSEPALLASGSNAYPTSSSDPVATSRYQQFHFAFNPQAPPPRSPVSPYSHSLHRGTSTGSLRELHHRHFQYPPSHSQSHHSGWKQEDESHHHQVESFHNGGGLDEPISPMQPNFSGGVGAGSPPTGLQYSPIPEDSYGPSPPGTGTSTSSNAPVTLSLSRGPHPLPLPPNNVAQSPSDGSNSKTYSFVALPGNAVKKRPRRRYDEIERLYQCSWPDCSKAYGTLNHLNAHVTMQKHGAKRSPNEFKELRKQWRKAKKETESPVTGPVRRGSMSMRREDSDLYDHPYASHAHQGQSPHQRHPSLSNHPSLGLATSVAVPQMGTDRRYPVENIRYPPEERDDHGDYGMSARQRYASAPGSAPASWHPSSRASQHHQYLPSSHPSQSHHTQLPQLNLNAHMPSHQSQSHHMPSPSHVTMNRLPADSTLLTPLPGYEPPNLLPPLQAGEVAYPADSYEMYEDDGRPGTGHGSLGRGSGDEY